MALKVQTVEEANKQTSGSFVKIEAGDTIELAVLVDPVVTPYMLPMFEAYDNKKKAGGYVATLPALDGEINPGEQLDFPTRHKGYLPVVIVEDGEEPTFAWWSVSKTTATDLGEICKAMKKPIIRTEKDKTFSKVFTLARHGDGKATRYQIIMSSDEVDVTDFEVPDITEVVKYTTREEQLKFLGRQRDKVLEYNGQDVLEVLPLNEDEKKVIDAAYMQASED